MNWNAGPSFAWKLSPSTTLKGTNAISFIWVFCWSTQVFSCLFLSTCLGCLNWRLLAVVLLSVSSAHVMPHEHLHLRALVLPKGPLRCQWHEKFLPVSGKLCGFTLQLTATILLASFPFQKHVHYSHVDPQSWCRLLWHWQQNQCWWYQQYEIQRVATDLCLNILNDFICAFVV